MSPPAFGDDIPLARRSRPPVARTPSLRQRLAWFLLGSTLVGIALFLTLTGPLRRYLEPTPVPGLAARLGADGRLLGHFPYPEAPASALVSVAPGLQLRPEAARSLEAMRQAAAAEGVNITVLSAFRPIELQKQLFFDVKSERNQSARERARVSAPPGFSEHSTGFAVDLGDGSRPDTNLASRFDTTAAYRWLVANADRYHFHLSFPRGNRQGVSYEPWHWRFEGSADALKMFEPAQRLAG